MALPGNAVVRLPSAGLPPGSARRQPVGALGRSLAAAFGHAPDADTALALVALLALVLDPVLAHRATEVGAVAFGLSLLTALPLVARRRHPLAVLAVDLPLVLVCLAVFHPNWAAVAVTMVLVFTVGTEGHRTRSLVVGALMAPVVALGALLTSSGHRVDAVDLIAYGSLVLGALVAGDAVRARRALVRATAVAAERERTARARRRLDAERLRLANEVHDSVGHALVAIQVQAAAAVRRQRRQAGTPFPSTLEDIAATAARALADLRATLRSLPTPGGPAPLHPDRELADLPELVDGVVAAGVRVDLDVPEVVANRLPAAVSHAAYRIVQEGLTNVLRHSAAATASVHAELDAGGLVLVVADPGPRRGGNTAATGRGVSGMVDRARVLGGDTSAGPDDRGGWLVRARLPVPAASR